MLTQIRAEVLLENIPCFYKKQVWMYRKIYFFQKEKLYQNGYRFLQQHHTLMNHFVKLKIFEKNHIA